jgi:hypothetical protein
MILIRVSLRLTKASKPYYPKTIVKNLRKNANYIEESIDGTSKGAISV